MDYLSTLKISIIMGRFFSVYVLLLLNGLHVHVHHGNFDFIFGVERRERFFGISIWIGEL